MSSIVPRMCIPFLVHSAKCYHKYYIINVCSLNALQTTEFLFTSKVEAIETTNGWCYISCSKYSRKLQRGFSSSPATHAMTVGLFILSFWLLVPISWKGSVFDEITTYVDLTKDFFLLYLI